MSKEESNSAHDDCGTCTDFKDWFNQNAQKTTGENKSKSKSTAGPSTTSSTTGYNYSECPLFRNQLGKATWSYLHTMAAYYPANPSSEEQNRMKEFIDTFAHTFPCSHCAKDFQKEIKKSPPRVDNFIELSKWFCEQHNTVNRKINKPEFDCSRVLERWRFSETKNPSCKGGSLS